MAQNIRHPIKMTGLCLFVLLSNSLSLLADQSPFEQQPYVRARQYELFAGFQYFKGDQVSNKELAQTAEIDDHFAGGFGIGYNFTEHWHYNFEIFFGGSEMDLVAGGVESELDIRTISFNVNVEYNLFDTRFTPLVSAGVGFFDTETDDKIGAFKLGENRVWYGVGAGARWDVSNKMFLKAVYRLRWTDLDRSDDFFDLQTINLYVGFKF